VPLTAGEAEVSQAARPGVMSRWRAAVRTFPKLPVACFSTLSDMAAYQPLWVRLCSALVEDGEVAPLRVGDTFLAGMAIVTDHRAGAENSDGVRPTGTSLGLYKSTASRWTAASSRTVGRGVLPRGEPQNLSWGASNSVTVLFPSL
jgi:hypothetical protein